jgi:hypothetical protein
LFAQNACVADITPAHTPPSFFVVAPLDPVRLLPALRMTNHGGRLTHAVFYYKEEPANALKQPPHGIIGLDAGTTVEPFAANAKHPYCVRISNAQQLMHRRAKNT